MIELLVVLGVLILLWLIRELVKAKQFTKFKLYIDMELKPAVLKDIKDELQATRNAEFPNNEVHIEATCFYWGQYRVRILQAALAKEIVTKQWLKDTGNYRNCQHLFHIEQAHLAKSAVERISLYE